jgi:hypothetical protein
MKRGGGVHTVPSPVGAGWWNKVEGQVMAPSPVEGRRGRSGARDRAAARGGAHDSPERRHDRGEELVRQRSVPAEGLEVRRGKAR